jgi:hypothetical protein
LNKTREEYEKRGRGESGGNQKERIIKNLAPGKKVPPGDALQEGRADAVARLPVIPRAIKGLRPVLR